MGQKKAKNQAIDFLIQLKAKPKVLNICYSNLKRNSCEPRHMHQLYQDAMSVVRCFGKLDLFITFTCNPDWPEIKVELGPYQSLNDRLDPINRVFRLKLMELLSDLLEKDVLGLRTRICYRVSKKGSSTLSHTYYFA
jgi:hypothetical protein